MNEYKINLLNQRITDLTNERFNNEVQFNIFTDLGDSEGAAPFADNIAKIDSAIATCQKMLDALN